MAQGPDDPAGSHHPPDSAPLLRQQCALSHRFLPRAGSVPLSQFNPLTHLVNGVRYSVIGRDFYAIGIHYVYMTSDLIVSFLALMGFAAVMFLAACQVFRRAVIT